MIKIINLLYRSWTASHFSGSKNVSPCLAIVMSYYVFNYSVGLQISRGRVSRIHSTGSMQQSLEKLLFHRAHTDSLIAKSLEFKFYLILKDFLRYILHSLKQFEELVSPLLLPFK